MNRLIKYNKIFVILGAYNWLSIVEIANAYERVIFNVFLVFFVCFINRSL